MTKAEVKTWRFFDGKKPVTHTINKGEEFGVPHTACLPPGTLVFKHGPHDRDPVEVHVLDADGESLEGYGVGKFYRGQKDTGFVGGANFSIDHKG